MTEESTSNFSSTWAILEIFGHQKYAGFVSVQTFGTTSMFRLDVPPLPEREKITREGCYVHETEDGNLRRWVNPGAKVKAVATEGYSKLFGVGAIYCLTPCTEEAAYRAVEEIQPRALMLVSLPPEKAIAAGGAAETGYDPEDDGDCLDCGKPLALCNCP